MDDVLDQENAENYVESYDQFVVYEVCLPDEWGKKVMARVTNTVKDNNGNPRDIEQPALFADHSLYEVSFTNGRTEELTANVISENMLSQVYSEGHHYQVIKDISDHYADESAL